MQPFFGFEGRRVCTIQKKVLTLQANMFMMRNRRKLGVFLLLVCVHLSVLGQEVLQDKQVEKEVINAKTKKSHFTWSASALFTSNYIWRGLYVGGPSVQLDATVSYAGVFANVWWNIGATDWAFSALNPEVDVAIGFSRWGLSVYYLHCYYFDRYADGQMSHFFDFRNNVQGGTTGEWRVAYNRPVYTNKRGWTTSVNALCAFRTFGRDGYYEDASLQFSGRPTGYSLEVEPVWKRAYSTYIEVGVDQTFEHDWSLAARVGITPAKSIYTFYQGDFAVAMVGLKLNKSWDLGAKAMRREEKGTVSDRGVRAGRLNMFAHVMLQPWQVNADNLILPIKQASNQKLNISVGLAWSI